MTESTERLPHVAAARVLPYILWAAFLGPLAHSLLALSVLRFQVAPGEFLRQYAITQVHFVVYSLLFCAAMLYLRTDAPEWLRSRWYLRAGAFFAVALTASAVSLVVVAALGLKSFTGLWAHLPDSLGPGIVITLIVLTGERLYFALVTTRLLAERRALEQERERRATAEAKWSSLQSRVHPHFLFNTLSSIRELIHRDTQLADRTIQKLAELLRFSLDSSRHELIPLGEELAVTRAYLEIEGVRLGPRLQWDDGIPAACHAHMVPPLSLLTLVENSVKHVVSRSRSGGRVSLAGETSGGSVTLTVSDSGPGFTDAELTPGHGLDLLRQRLATLYGSSGELVIGPTECGAAVQLRVPSVSAVARASA